MDFSKAFDVVPHNRHVLISNFLIYRQQRVVVRGDHSDGGRVQSGVPQVIVLCPLLFLLYIKDLPDNITSTVRLFADDHVIYRTITNDLDADELQADIDR